jgi:hypothetical protein
LLRAGRLVQLLVSIASLVLGLMVLIPLGVAIAPLLQAYSRVTSGRSAA